MCSKRRCSAQRVRFIADESELSEKLREPFLK